MDKINFENLPSTNTPISAGNLNAIQTNAEKVGNYIGSTQPSTGEKVWFKTGATKQILIKNDNGVFENFYEEDYDTGWVDMSSFVNTDYFAVRPDLEPMARKIGNVVYWKGEIYCHTVPNDTVYMQALTNIPNAFQPSYQYSSSGCTYDTNLTYNIFVLSDKIIISHRNIIATTSEKGYQLTNISGYIID